MLSHGILGFVTASWLADLTPMTSATSRCTPRPLSPRRRVPRLGDRGTGRPPGHPARHPASIPRPSSTSCVEARVTNTWLVPTQIVMLVDALGDDDPALPTSGRSSTAVPPSRPADLRQAVERFGPVFVQLFGQGETPMTATVLSARDHEACLAGDRPERLASAGRGPARHGRAHPRRRRHRARRPARSARCVSVAAR